MWAGHSLPLPTIPTAHTLNHSGWDFLQHTALTKLCSHWNQWRSNSYFTQATKGALRLGPLHCQTGIKKPQFKWESGPGSFTTDFSGTSWLQLWTSHLVCVCFLICKMEQIMPAYLIQLWWGLMNFCTALWRYTVLCKCLLTSFTWTNLLAVQWRIHKIFYIPLRNCTKWSDLLLLIIRKYWRLI